MLCVRVQVYSHCVYLSIWNRIRISPYCTKFYWILHKSSRVFLFSYWKSFKLFKNLRGDLPPRCTVSHTRELFFPCLIAAATLSWRRPIFVRRHPFGRYGSLANNQRVIFNLPIFGFIQSGRLSCCSRGASVCFHFFVFAICAARLCLGMFRGNNATNCNFKFILWMKNELNKNQKEGTNRLALFN